MLYTYGAPGIRFELEICEVGLEATIQTQTNFTVRALVNRFLLLALSTNYAQLLRFLLPYGDGNHLQKVAFSLPEVGSIDDHPLQGQGTPGSCSSMNPLTKCILNRQVLLFADRDRYITIEFWMVTLSSLLNNFTYHFEPFFLPNRYSNSEEL